jgi:hypothetical protein
MDTKVSEVLASTTANTKALEELKSMLSRCMGRFKDAEDGSPFESRSVLDERPKMDGTAHPGEAQGRRVDSELNAKRTK